jgi:predicted nucleotidyltransferase
LLDVSRACGPEREVLAQVVSAALPHASGLAPDHIMVVGATCRDLLHSALGHTSPNTATRDVDLALALSSWTAYRSLAAAFPRVGDSAIRFRIAGVDVDLLPFGGVEEPTGMVDPPARHAPFSVWAFEEIFNGALRLPLTPQLTVRLPTVAGFAAAKMRAWLDRSEWYEAKDARDLALVLHWYARSGQVADLLYETESGNAILIREGADLTLAAAHLLGSDVADALGSDRQRELLEDWPGDIEFLIRELVLHGGPPWPQENERRRHLVEALARGLAGEAAP